MKYKTENYHETHDMLGWLTCVVNEVKYHAPMADTPTLFKALAIAQKNREIGKMKILCRELFFRLEPGDKVYTIGFDLDKDKVPDWKSDWKIDTVSEWTHSGKYVHLQGVCGCWGWQNVMIVNPFQF